MGKDPDLYLTMDAWRGLGALVIVVFHSLDFWGAVPETGRLIPYLVDMFFLFSGFVVAFAFEPRLLAGMTSGEFIRQRLIRLWPLFTFGTVFGLLLMMARVWDHSNVDPWLLTLEIAPQMVMLPSFVPSPPEVPLYTMNPVCWSLFFELCANLAFILIWRWLTTPVLVGVVLFFAVALGISIYTYDELQSGYNQATFFGGFARAGLGFFAGVLIYRLLGRPSQPPKKTSWLALLVLPPIIFTALLQVPEESRLMGQLMMALFIGPAWMVFGLMMQPPKFLHRLAAWLGAISYALYVIHAPIVLFMQRLLWAKPELLQPLDNFTGLGILVVSVALAGLAERYYDRPMRKWLLRVTKRRPRQASMNAVLAK